MSGIYDANPKVQALIQQGLLERMMLDALYKKLAYRTAFTQEGWNERASSVYKTRRGVRKPDLRDYKSRTDPTPSTPSFEQFFAELGLKLPFATDESMRESGKEIVRMVIDAFTQAGETGGMAMDLLARNALFGAALEGHTVADGAISSTALVVKDINGFGVMWDGVSKFAAVSVSNPQPIYVRHSGAWVPYNVTAVTPATPGATTGPGTLTCATSVTASDRDAVVASTAPMILRAGGGYSIDDIGDTDTLALSDMISAVAMLRNRGVPVHADGTYHAYVGSIGMAQLLKDSDVKLIDRGQGIDNSLYRTVMFDKLAGCTIFECGHAPNPDTVAADGEIDRGIWSAELVNATSVPIERAIITGRDVGTEYAVSENRNSMNGKVIAQPRITNNGIVIDTDNLRMVVRDPIDRMQDIVSFALEFEGTHCIGTDYLAQGAPIAGQTGSSRFKRQVVIEHAYVL